MLTILVVDDEKLERKGIRFLLNRRSEEMEILEAANGKAACEILQHRTVDIMLTDIKMPFMDGIELVSVAHKLQPDLQMVIFSGYGEFEYAKKAMASGVSNYVLKPVDPAEFENTLNLLVEKITERRNEAQRSQWNQDSLENYFLFRYLCQGNADLLNKISGKINIDRWDQIRGLFLIESEDNFFEESEEVFIQKLTEYSKQKLSFLNLAQNQELCVLFGVCEQKVFATDLAEWMNHTFGNRFYVAVGQPVTDRSELPDRFQMLESLIENKFYQKETRVFLPDHVSEDTGSEQFLDETISRMIENIRLDDMTHLWEHFHLLKNGMGDLGSYSQIYTRFLFSNLVKEFFTHQHQDRKKLETAVQKVYEMQSVQEVISLVETLIQNMEERLAASKDGARNEVAQAKSYIYEHYSEDISVEKLSELVYLSPGYFSYIFKKETGDTVSRFIRNYRMELEELTEEIQSMDEMNIQATVHSNREDEMGILINSYNHMMQRIQELIRENYETQIARKEFEMKALQAQINPHFLYNSLSMINWKAIEAGEEEISQVTLALSAFYRTTLNKGRTWISLRLALQNIQAYVQLQLWMHDNDFNVHYDVDEKLLDYELPSLIFQPFVENALEHGLDIKEDPNHQIWFRIWEDPQTDLIYVSIRDNGVGMDTDTLAHVLEYHATGYGVKNVNDRMKLSFGEAYTIQIKSEQGKGTEVLLHFPKVQKGESNES